MIERVIIPIITAKTLPPRGYGVFAKVCRSPAPQLSVTDRDALKEAAKKCGVPIHAFIRHYSVQAAKQILHQGETHASS